jgi:hypothetical protein
MAHGRGGGGGGAGGLQSIPVDALLLDGCQRMLQTEPHAIHRGRWQLGLIGAILTGVIQAIIPLLVRWRQ